MIDFEIATNKQSIDLICFKFRAQFEPKPSSNEPGSNKPDLVT